MKQDPNRCRRHVFFFSSCKSLSRTSRCSWGPRRWAGWPPAWRAGPKQRWWRRQPTPASSWTCQLEVKWAPAAPCEPAGGPEEGTATGWCSPCPGSGAGRPSGGSAGQRCVYRGSGPYHSDLGGGHKQDSSHLMKPTADVGRRWSSPRTTRLNSVTRFTVSTTEEVTTRHFLRFLPI